eukprot:CAMPEP_0116838468 /NCGR_PEP_ID=MMETSP0418-20121206/9231_1 /TAXON_ID=1158023 /ORGANISM="Astrosyne radiata, Strain 13vi08-1A" /LENGTH=345 /DNA_ID=CAMNT_0004468477 /DNA_START=163 /DNA_END=1200 /DNA_ORIENTATION=-
MIQALESANRAVHFPEDEYEEFDEDEESRLWELPRLMGKSSRHFREMAPGVLMEGWLYLDEHHHQGTTTKTQTSWNRLWFSVETKGIYYFRPVEGGSCHSWRRIRVCDLIACSVREMDGSNDRRFCFELVTPSQRPLRLQARGPIEYNTWVEGLRRATKWRINQETKSSRSSMVGKSLSKALLQYSVPSSPDGGMLDLESPSFPDTMHVSHLMSPDGAMLDHESPPTAAENSDTVTTTTWEETDSLSRQALYQMVLDATAICSDCGTEKPDIAFLSRGHLVCEDCCSKHQATGRNAAESNIENHQIMRLSRGEEASRFQSRPLPPDEEEEGPVLTHVNHAVEMIS